MTEQHAGDSAMDHYCTDPDRHTTTRLVQDDWPRCDECGGLLAHEDPRMKHEQQRATLTIDITAKIVKVTAEVELYAGDTLVGTQTLDLTPERDAADHTAVVVDPTVVTPPTIVIAQNEYRAALIAEKLGIANPIITSARTAAEAVRGFVVNDIVIDDECKGIATDTMNELRSALTTPGLIMRYVERPAGE